jgi:hypothetical protein
LSAQILLAITTIPHSRLSLRRPFIGERLWACLERRVVRAEDQTEKEWELEQ